MCTVAQKKVVSMFVMLEREVHSVLSRSDVSYKIIKQMDQKLRTCYVNDALSGGEYSLLIGNLWRTWFNGGSI